ncbi:MAG: hypothetical protein ACO3LE_08900, partial [Bdellovibrionota bacterium]
GFLLGTVLGRSNNSLLNPSLNFSLAIDDIEIITPRIGEQGVCLRPKIQVDVPSGATCDTANFGKIRDGIFLYREGDDRVADRINLASPRRISIESNRCVLELKPADTLLENTNFVLETSFNDISGQAFSPTESITFKTGSLSQSLQECGDDSFKVLADNGSGVARNWIQITNIAYTGLRDANGDYILPDGNELLDVALGSANSMLTSLLGLSSTPNPIKIRFDRRPDLLSLQESLILRVYEGTLAVPGMQSSDEYQDFPISASDIQLLQSGLTWNAWVSLPGNMYYENGKTYIFVLLNTLQDTGGRFLDSIYMNAVRPPAN